MKRKAQAPGKTWMKKTTLMRIKERKVVVAAILTKIMPFSP